MCVVRTSMECIHPLKMNLIDIDYFNEDFFVAIEKHKQMTYCNYIIHIR